MTVASTTRKAGPFTGDGVVVAFPFVFKVFAAADLLVVQTAAGVDTTKTLTADYTVALNADQNVSPGGTVTMLVAPPVGNSLTLSSQVANTQGTDLSNQGGFFPKVLNDALDRATIQIQQLADKLVRSLQLPLSSTASGTLPAPVASSLIGWDSLGASLMNYAGLASSAVSAAMAPVVAAATLVLARAAMGATAVGDALFTTASAAAARDTLGVGSISNRNRLINGNFAINQRGVASGAVLAAGAYGHDRWKAGAGGCTYTYAVSGNDTVITITAGSLLQVIEDKNVEGGVYSLQNAGTAQARIAVSGAATSGAYAAATSAAPLASAAATANQTISVEFTLGTLSKVQLEPGTVATPFERRPFGAELALCQRYFEKSYDTTLTTLNGTWASGTLTAFLLNAPSVRFAVTKRAAPTLFLISPSSGAGAAIAEYNTASVYVADRTPAVATVGPSGFEISSSSMTVGNFVRYHWTAAAEL